MLAVPLVLVPPNLHAQARQPGMLTIRDPSPDMGFGQILPGQAGSAGRVLSLAMAPDGKTLYAAAEISGVWKSTDAARHWAHASNGLRNGFTAGHASLAVDGKNPNRLLYATGDDDGRGQAGKLGPYGGLWVSDDSATNWSHVALCTGDTNIQSVIFASGQPYVATQCGLFTTGGANLATAAWTTLPWPQNTNIREMADGGNQTLFTCANAQSVVTHQIVGTVYRFGNIGSANLTQKGFPLPGSCSGLAPAPVTGSAATESVVAGFDQGGNQQVEVLTFPADEQPIQIEVLAPASILASSGSGLPQVRTQHILSAPPTATAAGVAYDVYLADGCAWWSYKPSPAGGTWVEVAPLGSECNGDATGIHADTWDMAFSPTYDPPNRHCDAFAATDGGVYASMWNIPNGGCLLSWVPAQSGLHALNSMAMAGLPSGLSTPAVLYLPNGDNGTWVRLPTGQWMPTTYLGDGGQALADPIYQASVEVSRNGKYYLAPGPSDLLLYAWVGEAGKSIFVPIEITPNTDNTPSCHGQTFSCYYDKNWGSPGNGGIAVVETLPGATDAVFPGDYVAIATVDSASLPGAGAAMIVRCWGNNCINPVQWSDVSPSFHFPQGAVKVLAVGGHTNPVIYVLTPGGGNTNPQSGQLLRGVYGSGTISDVFGIRFISWQPANGTGSASLTNPINFFVNPYDAAELYAVDRPANGQSSVKISRDSGATWKIEQTLTDFATNSQPGTGNPYRFDCNPPNSFGVPYPPFLFGCALSWVTFDPFNPNVRVATSEFGGLAFSRDGGHNWMALNVTDNALSTNSPLTQEVNSAFYDGGLAISNVFVPAEHGPTIYAALHGSSMMSVAGPFSTLEQMTMYVPPLRLPTRQRRFPSVKVVVSPMPNTTIDLQRNDDGSYSGTLLFDSAKYSQLSFKFEVDGFEGLTPVPHPLTNAELSSGVAKVTCEDCDRGLR